MTSKVWFVTGAGNGWGRQIAEQLLTRGDRVAGTGRDTAALDVLKQCYGGAFWSAVLDFTDVRAVKSAVDEAAVATTRAGSALRDSWRRSRRRSLRSALVSRSSRAERPRAFEGTRGSRRR